MSDRKTTSELLERLQRHYIKPGQPLPGGVFVPECGINGGRQSRVDAVYVGFTSASGRILVGHELKASRADWRKELDTVGKADFWADNCHAWYIVAPGPEIVPPEEIPNGWGLMYPNARTKTRMDVKVRATLYSNRTPEWTAVRSVLARLDTLRMQHDNDVRQAAREQADKDARDRVAREQERAGRQALTPEDHRRLSFVTQLEELLGEPIPTGYAFDQMRPEQVAAALKVVRAGDAFGLRGDKYAADHLAQTADQMLKALAGWEDARTALLAVTS